MRRRFAVAAALSLGLASGAGHADPSHIARAAMFPSGSSEPQTQFRPDTAEIRVGISLHDVAPGDKVTATWIAEKANGVPLNYKIDSSTVAVPDSKVKGTTFRLSKPNNGWPVGDYRVDVTYNGRQELSQHFKVVEGK